MLWGLSACGEEEPAPAPEGEVQIHYLVYQMIVPKDVLKVASVRVSVTNPVTGGAHAELIDGKSVSFYNLSDYKLLNDRLALASIGAFNPDRYFVYYYLIPEVKNGGNYKMLAEWTVDDGLAAALDDSAVYSFSVPSLSEYVVDESNKDKTPVSCSVSYVAAAKGKFVEMLKAKSSVEISGTLNFTPSKKP